MNTKGFTLIEILVVLGISIILATGGFLGLWNLKKHQALRLSAEGMVAFLRDAQQKSVNQEGGFGWGVHFDNSASGRDSYWRFSGTDSLGAVDKVVLPAGVEITDPISGTSKNVIFAKISGLPDSPTEVKLNLSNDASVFRVVKINAQGTITQLNFDETE